MYKALSYFTDLQDGKHAYHAGDIYPRKGYEPSKERIKELSTSANKRGVPVIAEIGNKKPTEAVESVKAEVDITEAINPPIEGDNEPKAEPKKRVRKAKKNAE